MFQRATQWLHFILLFSITVISIVGLSYSFPSHAQSTALPDNIRGALCLVRADEQIVLVNEKITGKFSLPGGGISPHEPASVAAEREAWEETGLVVTAKSVIGYTGTAVIFDCVSDSELVAYEFRNQEGGYVLPIWFAPHYGVETNSAMLIDPNRVNASQYRYAEQWDAIRKIFAIASEQPALYLDDLVDAAPVFHQREIELIQKIQNSVSLLPEPLSNIVGSIIVTGDIFGQSWLILILFPVLFSCVQKKTAIKIMFVFVSTSLLTLVARQGFSLPAPYAYLPELQRLPEVGLSFPNMVITLWVSCSLVLLSGLKLLDWNKFSAMIIMIVVWFGLSQVYAGVTYFSDIVVGAILGILIAWHVERLERKPDIDLDKLLSSKGLWSGIALICLILTVIWPQPIFTQWLSTIIVITVILSLPRNMFKFEDRSLIPLVGSIGLMIISLFLLNHLKAQLSFSSIYALIIETVRFPAMIVIWLIFYLNRFSVKRI